MSAHITRRAAGASLGLILLAGASLGQDPAKVNVNLFLLDIQALQTIDALDLRPAQLEALAALAKTTADENRKRDPAKVSNEYRKTVVALRAALLKGAENVDELQEKLDELDEKEDPEVDTAVNLTDAARQKAPALLRQLGPAQITSLLKHSEPEDPVEILAEALESGKTETGDGWKETRDEAATEFGTLLGGLNKANVEAAEAKARKLLDELHQKQEAIPRSRLEDEVRQLLGDADGLTLVRNHLEHALAELLSNPRLGAALEARKKATGG